MGTGFKFKQFFVSDDKCSMKVGTDAVILGSWVNTRSAKTILDIGTGSGIIAMMMAQRSNAVIDAIDIDPASAEKAEQNCNESKWNDRINISHCSLQEFQKTQEKKYDLIVTNPPFFSASLHSPDESRNLARHNDKLSFEELIAGVSNLLDGHGRFALILPEDETEIFKEKALINGLYGVYELLIYPKKGRNIKRICTEFSFQRQRFIKRSSLVIRNNDNTFTSEYTELTKEFYLVF